MGNGSALPVPEGRALASGARAPAPPRESERDARLQFGVLGEVSPVRCAAAAVAAGAVTGVARLLLRRLRTAVTIKRREIVVTAATVMDDGCCCIVI